MDLPRPDAWGRLNEVYRAALPAALKESALNIQIYAGAAHAVGEISRSLAKLYTHKKTIAIVSGTEASFNSVAVAFSADGFNVKSVTPEEAQKPETWTPLMDELLFVLSTEDDAITGRVYTVDKTAFQSKRVFRIQVSHARLNLVRPEPFEIHILSLSSSRALMVAGERAKIDPETAPHLFWPDEIPLPIAAAPENETAVRDFEKNLPPGFKAYFAEATGGSDAARTSPSRVYDRIAIYHEEIDGSALIDELAETLKLKIKRPGEAGDFETTSACRWESPRFQEWLLSRGETLATTRGLVLIAAELAGPALRTHLETAAAKILRLQNG